MECFVAALLFGATTPFLKLTTAPTSPLWSAGLLYLGAALAVAPTDPSHRQESRISYHAITRVSVAVFLGGCVAPVLLLIGLEKAEAAEVSLWLGLETVFTALIAHVFFHEHLSKKVWAANGLVVVAGALAAGFAITGLLAVGLVASACLCWAIDNNLSAAVSEVSPRRLVLIKGAVAGSVNLAAGCILGQQEPGALVALSVVLVGVVGYGFSLLLYLRGARRLGAARSQMIFAFAPLTGVMLSWGLLREPVETAQVLAVAVFFCGLWLLSSERHAHLHAHEGIVHTHEHRHDDEHHIHAHPGLPPQLAHTHEHTHQQLTHVHSHMPDVHHRHGHSE